MPASEYFAAPGLSQSAMKDLAVSPLRYWHLHVNPDRPPDEPTSEMQFGQALHCAVLEPREFSVRYCQALDRDDIEGCLETMEDIRGWLHDRGIKPKGTKKADVIRQAVEVNPDVPIFEMIRREHYARNSGKTMLTKAIWERVTRAADSLLSEPRVREILSEGQPEVCVFRKDEETGVLLKGRLDWVSPKMTVDPKTFSQKRGKSIDKSIADAIFYEGYYLQAFFYALLRGWPLDWRGDHVMPFVESEEPHEVRIKVLRATTAGQPNLYWERARLECRELIRLYAECASKFGFGKTPWRYAQEMDALMDEELPGMIF